MTEDKKAQSEPNDPHGKEEIVIDNPEVIEEFQSEDQTLQKGSLMPSVLVALVVSIVVVAAAYFLREPLGWNEGRSQAQSVAALSENLQGRLATLEKEVREKPADTAVADLKQQLESLKGELSKLRTDAAAASAKGVSSDDLAALSQQVSAMKAALSQNAGTIKQLNSKIQSLVAENDKLGSALATVNSGLATVEQKQSEPSGNSGQASAFLVAATQVKILATSGQNFESELNALRKLAGSDTASKKAIEELAPVAKSGIATVEALKAQMPALIKEIKAIEATENDASLLDAVLGQMTSVVTVRRTDGAETLPGVDGVIARVSLALDNSDLSKAIQELQSLGENYQSATSDWLAKAIESEKTISLSSELQLTALQAISQ